MKQILYSFLISLIFIATGSANALGYVPSGWPFILPANTPRSFANITGMALDARCTIVGETNNNLISFTLMRKTAMVNNVLLAEGETSSIVLNANDTMDVVAPSGAKVEITNNGPEVIAYCVLK